MKKVFRFLTAILMIQIVLISCITSPNSPSSQREIKHMQEYLFKDQSTKNEFHKNQDFDDLTGCPILVDMNRWAYSESKMRGRKGKMRWGRHQSWRYPDGIISETGTGIDDENFVRPKESSLIYVGPWKHITLKKGLIWGDKIDKKIRFIAMQKKNDVRKGYIYASYEFMTPYNQDILEQSITLAKDLPTPDFETFCEVKWVAKYGYNAIFDTKAGKIIEAKE